MAAVAHTHLGNDASRFQPLSPDSGVGDMGPFGERMESVPPSDESSSGVSDFVDYRNLPERRRRRSPSPAPAFYKDPVCRQNSFEGLDWPSNLEAQPNELVRAGFYYVGPADRVKCAFCGGKLKRWLPQDSAIAEHLKHFPHCPFAKDLKKEIVLPVEWKRSRAKRKKLISSDTLMREQAKNRMQYSKHSPENLAVMTLEKMGYSKPVIKKVKKKIQRNNSDGEALTVQRLLEEIQKYEREIFLNGGAEDEEAEDELEMDCDADEEEDSDVPEEEIQSIIAQQEQELRDIGKEKEELTNRMTCKICLETRVESLFLPCRHLVTCKSCGERLPACPICRQPILGTVDVSFL